MKICLLLFAALMLAACSPSAYRMHSTAVVTVAGAHAVTGAAVDAARDSALDAVEAEHPETGEARTAALRAEAARWTPAGLALDSIRSALGTWLSAVELARAADDGGALLDALLPLAARVLGLWDDLAALLQGLDVDAPRLPEAVRALVGGVL